MIVLQSTSCSAFPLFLFFLAFLSVYSLDICTNNLSDYLIYRLRLFSRVFVESADVNGKVWLLRKFNFPSA